MQVTFDHTQNIAKDIVSFWFKPEKSVRYIAGQFIELTIPHDSPDSRGTKRWFTLSSSPTDEMLSVTTRFAKSGGSTFKDKLRQIKPGTKLHMASPMGDFVLPKDQTIPLLFVAGGIGCTPFHSIVKFLQDTKSERDIKMIYGANNFEDVAFSDTFSYLGDNFEILLSNPPDSWAGKVGRIDAKTIFELSESGKRRIYISGPEPMVESLDKELRDMGIKPNDIHGDFFPGYTPI